MKGPIKRGIIIRNEKSSANYNTDFLHRVYAEEGKGVFDVRTITLGHIQQGGAPSPFDRSYATKCGSIASAEMLKIITQNWDYTTLKLDMKNSKICRILGINRRKVSLQLCNFTFYIFVFGVNESVLKNWVRY